MEVDDCSIRSPDKQEGLAIKVADCKGPGLSKPEGEIKVSAALPTKLTEADSIGLPLTGSYPGLHKDSIILCQLSFTQDKSKSTQ